MTHERDIADARGSTACKYRKCAHFALLFVAFILTGCSQLERPKTEPFYAQTEPPPRQEFRWSNGRTPKSIDPARAAAPPETDVVRAIYEGLTDLDPRTLKEMPAVAEKWESSPDLKTWTFHLRKDSRWSNGETVVADDFVRSWHRLAQLKDQAANRYLFENIVGMKEPPAAPSSSPDEPTDFLRETASPPHTPLQKMQMSTNSTSGSTATVHPEIPAGKVQLNPIKIEPLKFGVEAIDDRTLKITLQLPDKDFAKLVANPVFRPIYGDGAEFNEPDLDPETISNGAFRIASIGDNGISLERSETYWNRKSVGLERVRFVPMDTAEKALEAYKAGAIDAVSNADFEPLALKLLTPYEDFRRTTHSALNFYEVNSRSLPFSDRRVRAALAISIDRERLTEGELEGSTQPAYSFLPLGEPNMASLSLDVERARELLTKAGYPNGENFPQVRLVVNRNDAQQRIARTVARMWRQNLNLDTLVIVKESSEMEKTRQSGDFDLIRRGVVIPTVDQLVGLSMLFDSSAASIEPASQLKKVNDAPLATHLDKDPLKPADSPATATSEKTQNGNSAADQSSLARPNEEDSLFDIYAIPLYFPTSYALVKPYVRGFDVNGLDAPSLKAVTIDNAWQPKGSISESN
jgi:oligopeptide transport system substrate-binding protein